MENTEEIDEALKNKVDDSGRTAESFAALYYHFFDKRRHQMCRFYLDNALFVWNGNGAKGKGDIHKYFVELPFTEHTLTTLDAQPIVDDSDMEQKTYLIQAAGRVKYTDSPSQNFQQTFIITFEEDTKWKIASDCYRLQNALN